MFCPVCKQDLPKSCWSPSQWCHYKAQLEVNYWTRNCCKECSDVDGWFFNKSYDKAEIATKGTEAARREAEHLAKRAKAEQAAKAAEAGGREAEAAKQPRPTPPPPPPPKDCTTWVPDLREMSQLRGVAVPGLQRNVGGNFWEALHTRLCEINLDRREELVRINRSLGLKDKKSFRKLLSLEGAVRVPDSFPDKFVSWVDRQERQFDSGNRIYQKAFRAVWPMVLPEMVNKETVGDLIEAFLAIAWKYRSLGVQLPELCLDFVEFIEILVFTEFVLDLWG